MRSKVSNHGRTACTPGYQLLCFFAPQQRTLPRILRYALAVVFVAIATAVRWSLVPWMGNSLPYSIAVPALLVTTALLSIGPGLLFVLLEWLGNRCIYR